MVTGDRGAQVIVAPEIAGHLEMALTQVRSVPVKVRKIPLSELRVQAPKAKDISSVEASMRLDAIASAGFQMSRSKVRTHSYGDLVLLIAGQDLTLLQAHEIATGLSPGSDWACAAPRSYTTLQLLLIQPCFLIQMAELIEGGDVKVNWKGILKKDWEIKGSDVISVRGKGRVIVQEVNQNKKDRFVVKMQRLV